MPSVTPSGNEITDARRAEGASVPVVGHSYDGLLNDSSFGIWEASTNFCQNGGFETNLTGYSPYQGATLTRDSAQAKFGTWSMKVVTPGVTVALGGEGTIGPGTGSGTASAGETWVGSAWVYSVAGGEQVALVFEERTSVNAFLTSSQKNFTLIAGWQRLSVTRVLTNSRVSQVGVDIRTTTTVQAITVWVDGFAYEKRRAAVTLTTTGNEITDATRLAGASLTTASSGQMEDGLSNDSSFGIRRAATNLFRRGQCDTTADVVQAVGGETIAVDATTPAPFSPQSIKVTTPGVGANEGALIQTATGQAAAVGVNAVGSTYFKGVVGQSYRIFIRWRNTDATNTVGATATFTATGSWQLVSSIIGSVAVATGKTGDAIWIRLDLNGTRAETFWVAHAMLESGQSVVAPYVATSGGVTATHAAGRVQAPTGLLNSTQGFIATRLRLGFAATAGPGGGTANDRVFNIADAGNNKVLLVYYSEATQKWSFERWNGASQHTVTFSTAQTFNAGDFVTIVVYWTATTIAISVNGAAFQTVADANGGAVLSTFDIGSSFGNAAWINSDAMWLTSGTGTLTNADATTLNALGSTDPNVDTTLGATAAVTAVWSADSSAYVTPGATTQVATPYVHTDGAAQARGSARVQAPASLLTATKLWFALRVRYGWSAASRTDFPGLVTWATDPNNRVGLLWNGSTSKWVMDRRIGGAPIDANSSVLTYVAGDFGTVIGYYDGANLGISVNGAAFVTNADARALVPSGATFDIGSVIGGAIFDGDVKWFACGQGVLTNADASTFNNFGDTDPLLANLLLTMPNAAPTMVWPADTAAYSTLTPVCLSEPVIFGN